jgi:hypothetical protein
LGRKEKREWSELLEKTEKSVFLEARLLVEQSTLAREVHNERIFNINN